MNQESQEQMEVKVQIEKENSLGDDHEDENQNLVEDLLFGDIEFESKEFKIERLSHSQKKLQQYHQHLQKHTDKEFLKDKWNQRKKRVNKRLDGLSNDEKFQERCKRKEEIEQERQNMIKGYESGIPLIIDNSFEQYMTFREIRSLAIQISQTVFAQRKNKNPFQVNVCNASQQLKDCMNTQILKKLPFNVYEQDILEIERFKGKQANMIYLSPDSENELETVDSSGNTIYIVGGLIDRTVKKWASFDRANSMNIKSAKLPINSYLSDLTRRALNIDTVTVMMGLAIHLNFDWKTTTLTVLGNRKINEDLKEEQKQVVQEGVQKLGSSKLDKSSHLIDVYKSIESRLKKQNKQILNEDLKNSSSSNNISQNESSSQNQLDQIEKLQISENINKENSEKTEKQSTD
ncbi:hypothetical protein ABPG72_018526 [Tetrahymena utriculariae]